MPYHHILPVLLISGMFFPLLHYSMFHSDYFCLGDLSPSPTPSPVCCIFSCFLHKRLYPLSKSNRCLKKLHNLSSDSYSLQRYPPIPPSAPKSNSIVRLHRDFSTLLLRSQDRKQKFVSSGTLAPDQPMHSVCSSHPGRGARQ